MIRGACCVDECLLVNQRHCLQVCWPSNTARSARCQQVIWLLRFLVYSAIQMTSHCRGGKERSWALKDKHTILARSDPSSEGVRASDRHDDGVVWKDAGRRPAAAVTKKKQKKKQDKVRAGLSARVPDFILKSYFYFLTTYWGHSRWTYEQTWDILQMMWVWGEIRCGWLPTKLLITLTKMQFIVELPPQWIHLVLLSIIGYLFARVSWKHEFLS